MYVASTLGVPMHKLVCKTKRIGGGFGGKETRSIFIHCAAAVPAYHLRRPVKAILDRDEDMQMTGSSDFKTCYSVISAFCRLAFVLTSCACVPPAAACDSSFEDEDMHMTCARENCVVLLLFARVGSYEPAMLAIQMKACSCFPNMLCYCVKSFAFMLT
jgi:hypothetical protein